jgi:hypothetical protein
MIVVTSLHNEAYEPLAEWTLYKNKKVYCEKHGYKLHYATMVVMKSVVLI